jgi:hypothetical protein
MDLMLADTNKSPTLRHQPSKLIMFLIAKIIFAPDLK